MFATLLIFHEGLLSCDAGKVVDNTCDINEGYGVATSLLNSILSLSQGDVKCEPDKKINIPRDPCINLLKLLKGLFGHKVSCNYPHLELENCASGVTTLEALLKTGFADPLATLPAHTPPKVIRQPTTHTTTTAETKAIRTTKHPRHRPTSSPRTRPAKHTTTRTEKKLTRSSNEKNNGVSSDPPTQTFPTSTQSLGSTPPPVHVSNLHQHSQDSVPTSVFLVTTIVLSVILLVAIVGSLTRIFCLRRRGWRELHQPTTDVDTLQVDT